ncbi:antitoxin MazE-like protein [Mycobacterium decipiens]|uniref:antitoxin MazE-like protein n=1 Tax=Mycobacterium decipiens TaxID=1430326 RepID=UPI001F61FF57|nr:antitoxin MazE-like protein [Mycobacterium decipiens]
MPDVRSPQFAEAAHREALALAEADRNSDDMDFVEAISALGDHGETVVSSGPSRGVARRPSLARR